MDEIKQLIEDYERRIEIISTKIMELEKPQLSLKYQTNHRKTIYRLGIKRSMYRTFASELNKILKNGTT